MPIYDLAEIFGWPAQLSPAAVQRQAAAALRAALAAQLRDVPPKPPPPPLPALEGEQLAALDRINKFLDANNGQYFTLHGLAGTGKTTVLAHLARTRSGAILATPTGKAATVLGRKAGADAVTLHRLLYTPQVDERGNLTGWAPNFAGGELTDRVVLADEGSMIGVGLAHDLLATGARIIAAGDPGQLPPVEEAAFFTEPDLMLHDIRRQAAGCAIIRQAHAIRAGQGYASDGDTFEVVDRREATVRLDWADIVLCWMNETRHRMNAFIRRRRGIAPDAPPQPGEPLMCLANQRGGMMNGEIFTVRSSDGAQGLRLDSITLPIERPWYEWLQPDRKPPRGHVPLALAYCITVHKAQGSEYPRVLVLDEFTGADRARWLYTATTRASEALCVCTAAGQ